MTAELNHARNRFLTQTRPSPLRLVVGLAALRGAILYGAAFTYFSQTTPDILQTAGSLLRNLGLMGLGQAILLGREPRIRARLASPG